MLEQYFDDMPALAFLKVSDKLYWVIETPCPHGFLFVQEKIPYWSSMAIGILFCGLSCVENAGPVFWWDAWLEHFSRFPPNFFLLSHWYSLPSVIFVCPSKNSILECDGQLVNYYLWCARVMHCWWACVRFLYRCDRRVESSPSVSFSWPCYVFLRTV